MNGSILDDIKKLLGEPYDHFNTDIILHINTAFSVLNQLGVGPNTPFRITDSSSTWGDFTQDINSYSLIKDIVYLRVKLIFDAPSNSFLVDEMKKELEELEWRAHVMFDRGSTEEED